MCRRTQFADVLGLYVDVYAQRIAPVPIGANLYAFILLTSTIVPGINYFVVITHPLHQSLFYALYLVPCTLYHVCRYARKKI